MDENLVIRQRVLPHWRLEYSTYFVTWCKLQHLPSLISEERSLIVDSILHFHRERYHVWAYVVMDDHVHVLLTPMNYPLSKILRTWKSYSARMINNHRGRTGSLWQVESFDRIIRNENEFVTKLEYILNNPLKRWPQIKNYKWADWTKDEFSYSRVEQPTEDKQATQANLRKESNNDFQ